MMKADSTENCFTKKHMHNTQNSYFDMNIKEVTEIFTSSEQVCFPNSNYKVTDITV